MAHDQRNALPNGTSVEGFGIEGVLGAGGFGITYRAVEAELERTVAIKEYLPGGLAMRGADGSSVHPLSSADREDYAFGLQRFRDEARTLVSFRHPNIVAVHRFFEANGTAYLVMQYVEGDALGAILARAGTLTEPEIREILFPILNGLEEVHKVGFLHRDIKPGNIFIQVDGVPVLLDFGAARQALGEKSASMTAIVTAGYAPFEQYSSRGRQGPWTDIYALGATLYRAMTGEKPEEATARIEEDHLVPAAEAARDRYDPILLQAIDRALAMKVADRPQSIAQWRALLTGAADLAAAAPAPGPAPVPKPAPAPVPQPVPAPPGQPDGGAGAAVRTARQTGPLVAAFVVVALIVGLWIYAAT